MAVVVLMRFAQAVNLAVDGDELRGAIDGLDVRVMTAYGAEKCQRSARADGRQGL